MNVLETHRLRLRWMQPEDAPFILRLLNDPTWLATIGDRGVRDLDGARHYIATGPMEMYARFGFGLYLAERKWMGIPVGICGLVKRETLAEIDLGFAMLSEFQGQGFTSEAAAAVVGYASQALGLKRLVAITLPENRLSIRVLEKLGFVSESMINLTPSAPALRLFGRAL